MYIALKGRKNRHEFFSIRLHRLNYIADMRHAPCLAYPATHSATPTMFLLVGNWIKYHA